MLRARAEGHADAADAPHQAFEGAGYDEEAIIEIMCTRSNAQIRAFKTAYRHMFGQDLERAMAGETGGDFRKLMISLLQVEPCNVRAPARAHACAVPPPFLKKKKGHARRVHRRRP